MIALNLLKKIGEIKIQKVVRYVCKTTSLPVQISERDRKIPEISRFGSEEMIADLIKKLDNIHTEVARWLNPKPERTGNFQFEEGRWRVFISRASTTYTSSKSITRNEEQKHVASEIFDVLFTFIHYW